MVSLWYSLLSMGYLLESYLISGGVLKSYKPLHLGKLRYLTIVIDSEDAHQTSKIVQLLQWLSLIGIKNVCLYDVDGVLKKSKEDILQKLKVQLIEEANGSGIHSDPGHMTLEFASYVDGKEAVTKAANLIFMENLKQHNSGGELGGQILIENDLDEALLTVGSRGPEPDLLLVYGPVRCHLGFPAWRLRYTEIVLLQTYGINQVNETRILDKGYLQFLKGASKLWYLRKEFETIRLTSKKHKH